MPRKSNSTKSRLLNLQKGKGARNKLEKAKGDTEGSDGSRDVESEDEDVVEVEPEPLPSKRVRKKPKPFTNENASPMEKPRQGMKKTLKPSSKPPNASSSRVEDELQHGRVVFRTVPQPSAPHPIQTIMTPAIDSSTFQVTSTEGIVLLAALREQAARTRMLEQRNLELLASSIVHETHNKQLRAQLEHQQKKIAAYEQFLMSSTLPVSVGGVMTANPSDL
ncbi:hypothetical protein BJ165DRAFT_606929 [Panaeolus papilionaceus]|nr:hypothetical protein BJ165DRAFT_606929 [Panaeolus papilionaceus]